MGIFKKVVITDVEKTMNVNFPKGKFFQMENRPSYALSFCISGQITYTHNGKKFISDANHAVLLPQGATYSILGNSTGVFPVINFKCENLSCDSIMLFPLKNTESILNKYKQLSNHLLYKDRKLKIFSLFYDILEDIETEQSILQTPLYFVIEYIRDRIGDPALSNRELADRIGISEVYLRKLFLAHYNISPKQYILDIRIHKAKQMLCDTPFTVSVIAEECGFSSVYHFCRAFKQRTGVTPTQYAQTNIIFKI